MKNIEEEEKRRRRYDEEYKSITSTIYFHLST
jgi:hypothetical protein